MAKKKCGNCRFWDKPNWECRKNPPVVVVNRREQPHSEEQQYYYTSEFPMAVEDSYCWEFYER